MTTNTKKLTDRLCTYVQVKPMHWVGHYLETRDVVGISV